MKTHKCLQIYTTKCKSRGHLYENIISNSKITRTRICEYTRCTKTCHASQACSKTQILYKKTYNHDAFCTKTYKHFKIYTKKFKSRGHLYENIIPLVSLFKSIYPKRPAVRKHATRHRPVRKHKYSIRKRIITMPSVRKRTNI